MFPLLEAVESVLDVVIHYSVLILEIIGAVLILYRSAVAVFLLLKGKTKLCRCSITDGITIGLSFLLVSEVLKTIIHKDWTSIGMTCAILMMRAAISILVHWEQKSEEASEDPKES